MKVEKVNNHNRNYDKWSQGIMLRDGSRVPFALFERKNSDADLLLCFDTHCPVLGMEHRRYGREGSFSLATRRAEGHVRERLASELMRLLVWFEDSFERAGGACA